MTTEPNGNDIFRWADGTWCYRSELSQMSYMSDDHEVFPAYSTDWYRVSGTDSEGGEI